MAAGATQEDHDIEMANADDVDHHPGAQSPDQQGPSDDPPPVPPGIVCTLFLAEDSPSYPGFADDMANEIVTLARMAEDRKRELEADASSSSPRPKKRARTKKTQAKKMRLATECTLSGVGEDLSTNMNIILPDASDDSMGGGIGPFGVLN